MFATSNFGTKLLTSAPYGNFGTKFDSNFNIGIIWKDYLGRSLWLVPKLVSAEVNENFQKFVPKFTRSEVRLPEEIRVELLEFIRWRIMQLIVLDLNSILS